MSLLWRDEIGVYVSPQKLVLARMKRGIRPQCVMERCVDLRQTTSADWSPPLAALQVQVASEAWHNANMRIAIADRWARYAIIPWNSLLQDDQEREAHARHVFTEMYGAMHEWTLALSAPVAGRAQVATALPTELVDGLRAIVTGNGCRLLSIEPQLVVAFNIARDRLPRHGCWFVSLDTGSLAAAHVTPHGWDRVHCVRLGENWAAELLRLRLLGRFSAGRASDECIYVKAPAWMRKMAGTNDNALEWLVETPQPGGSLERVSALKGHHP